MFRMTTEIEEKLRHKHGVTRSEVEECFLNRCGKFVIDDRDDTATDPPTQWFISETDKGRPLAVFFMDFGKLIVLKTAFEPSQGRIKLYELKAR